MKPILIMGLPGAGKTALATALAIKIKAVHWNADDIRGNINKDLGYSEDDRIEQATRLGWLSQKVISTGYPVVSDFVCPIPKCRDAFGSAFLIFIDRINESRFQNTNNIFVPPTTYNIRIVFGMTIDEEIDIIMNDTNFLLECLPRYNR